MRLGGVDIPADHHLVGHSDADAICHAVTDALLGAAGLGDIGALFPDSDPGNRGRDSIDMLRVANARLQDAGFRVVNVDVTVIAEHPRVGPYAAEMGERVAGVLGISPSNVSIKGKTNEGMGWIGSGEGLGAVAVALVTRMEG